MREGIWLTHERKTRGVIDRKCGKNRHERNYRKRKRKLLSSFI
jgi:hypothetical protein